jgi:hypothetical protein
LTQTLHSLFSTEIFMARGHSFLWTPWLLATELVTNAVLAAACVALAGLAFRRAARAPERRRLLRGLALLALGFAALHLLDTVVIWTPAYGVDAVVRTVTALGALAAVVALARARSGPAR